jgi:O-antigen/teichoic acid export membrane protein
MFKAYADFSVPLFLASCFLLIMAEAVILLPNWQLGLAAAGAITLSGNITQFTDRVDQIVTGTMYPAICAAKDRLDILAESFVKSNRLALMWAMPFGVGVTLFARDLVHFAIGDTWIPAIGPLEVFGVTAAVGHIGFNWDAYLRAVGNTRPIAWTTGISVVVFLATGVPLLFSNGLVGISLGLAFHVVAVIACRGYYLGRMFRGFNIMRHTLRAIIPTLPATAAVLLVRLVEHGTRTKAEAVGELALYALVTILATALTERPLVREAFGYLRGRSAVAAAA